MRTRKRRREVPSSGRPKRVAVAADQPSPLSTGGGGGDRSAACQSQPAAEREEQPVAPPHGFVVVGQGGDGDGRAAASQAHQVAGERQEGSESPVAPPQGFFMVGQFPLHYSSPVTSQGTAPKLTPPGSASQSSRSGSPKKCRLREKKSPPRSPPRSGSSSSSPSTHSFKTVRGRRWSRGNQFQEAVDLMRNYLQGNGSSLIDNMWENSDFNLTIDFFMLRRFNKEAAYKLCNENNIGMQAALSDAARDIVFESFKKNDFKVRFHDEEEMNVALLNNFKLMILNVPKRISSLTSAIANLRRVALRSLFMGHTYTRKVAEMEEEQRQLLVACLGKFLDAHRHKRSWNGQWDIGDWDCLDEHFFAFEVASTVYEDPEELFSACKADLRTFATEIVIKFKIRDVYPAYLSHLFNELNNEVWMILSEDYFGTKEEQNSWAYYSGGGWYMEFLEFHPSLLDAIARLNLIEGWYLCINDLGYEKWEEYHSTICGFLDWTRNIRFKDKEDVDDIEWLTFWYKAKKPYDGAPSSEWIPTYTNTWAQNHRYLRQLCHHAFRYTKFAGGNQSAFTTEEPELHAAKQLPNFLPDFVKHLLMHRMMTREFYRHWATYRKHL